VILSPIWGSVPVGEIIRNPGVDSPAKAGSL
jgi:hypothetical protein